MALSDIYTPKQIEVLKSTRREDWFMMFLHGAKRSGKTIINNDLFMMELRRVRQQADRIGIREPMYILAGVSSSTIQKNILQELYNKYHWQPKFDKHNNFTLMGVKVVQAYTGTIAGLNAIRGITAFGAYVNEGSLANREVFAEIVSRCSGEGARIITDTNPDNPQHWMKINYIDTDNPNIVTHQFQLDDNTFIDERYRLNIKQATPSGMFYDRDILGLWVSGEGVVYPDFDAKKHYITRADVPDDVYYFVGVDWGYEHYGAIVVMAEDKDGKVYLIEEHSGQHKEIDYWVNIAKGITRRYGVRIPFYCDSARPEYVARFKREGMYAQNASKSVLSGIEQVALLIKNDMFAVVEQNMLRFKDEIYQYIWDKSKDAPVKEHDDVMDAIRYAVYSNHLIASAQTGTTEQKIRMAQRLLR